ncbi:MAG: hypothetical protein ACOX8M_13745 [Marvinbryantia sp.]|jgi:hypothetical protein
MMGISSKKREKEAPEMIRDTLHRHSFSPIFLGNLLMRFVKYRMEVPVTEVRVFLSGDAYYICPRCGITLEREFMSYCDRFGQHLGWRNYEKAKVVYPDKGNRFIENSFLGR